MRTALVVLTMLLWLCCAAAAPAQSDAKPTAAIDQLLNGRFDNREQAAKAPPGAATAKVPHVTVSIEPTPRAHFALWHVHIATDPQTTYDQTWAMQTRVQPDGSGALIPYYQLHQDSTPAAASFDPKDWLSLEACALRGTFMATHVEALSEGEPCVAVSMSVGARRALLPVALTGNHDELNLYFDLRGARTHIDARRVR